MTTRALLLLLFALVFTHAQAQQTIVVTAGDEAGLIDAINDANQSEEPTRISLVAGPGGETDFVFTSPAPGYPEALPTISSNITITAVDPGIRLKTATEDDEFPLAKVEGAEGKVKLHISGITIEGFYMRIYPGAGFRVRGSSEFSASNVIFRDSHGEGGGGAVSTEDTATARIDSSLFINVTGFSSGGALVAYDESLIEVSRSYFSGSDTYSRGCEIASHDTAELRLFDNVFDSPCEGYYTNDSGTYNLDTEEGPVTLRGNTFTHAADVLFASGPVHFFGNLLNESGATAKLHAGTSPPPKTEKSCFADYNSTFESLGYNISWDNSCFFDQPSDLPDTNPMLTRNGDGLPVPQTGSPAVDAGMGEVIILEGETLASLPCPYLDLSGTARPQDGNGDGVFACDMGAMEAIGTGQVEAAHSGAFFNPSRDGEGTFVEIINDTKAVVYTFSYRPDGSGQSWFIGDGELNGNSIVVKELLRPVGTSFGAGFNADDIQYTPLGSMNIVAPDCTLAAPGGGVAYTGEKDVGYEAMLTRFVRLNQVKPCGFKQPSPKAGLSGSYFNPSRNGEGIIVEWMDNGQVLLVFFTYDQNNNQLWLIAQGTPVGNTVTMEAQYASAFTQWGSNYNANDVVISPWGTLTLNWTGCNAVTFEYSSTVPGYGSGSYSYQRLSKLQGTTCP